MPKVTEQILKKQIYAKEYNNIYYICGEEKMLVKYYNDFIKEKIMGKSPSDFNCHSLTNENTIDEIAVASYVVPFMEKINFVSVTDFNLNDLDKNNASKFTELIKTIPNTTIIVFAELTISSKGSKQGKRTALLKEITKQGTFLELNRMPLNYLKKQLVDWAKKLNIELSLINAEKIVTYTGTDLQLLKNELSKLCAYVETGEITSDIIEKIVSKNLEAKVFSLAELIANNNMEDAYKQLDVLFYQKEEAITILAVLSSAYGDMYRARVAVQSGHKSTELVDKFDYTERNAFRLSKAERISRKISYNGLCESIEQIKQADISLKSTAEEKHKLILEKLIAKLVLASEME